MRIESDTKLDYGDVLFRPKRSNIGSRNEVQLQRGYSFLNSHNVYAGVPIMAANMDGVGTFAMAETLALEYGMFTTLTKDLQPADIHTWFNQQERKSVLADHIAVSTGITDADHERNHSHTQTQQSNQVCVC